MYLSTYVSCTYICSYLDSKPVFLHIRTYICISCTYICNHLSLNLLPFIYIFIYVSHVYIYLQQFWVPSKRFQIDLNDWRLFKNFKIFFASNKPYRQTGWSIWYAMKLSLRDLMEVCKYILKEIIFFHFQNYYISTHSSGSNLIIDLQIYIYIYVLCMQIVHTIW